MPDAKTFILEHPHGHEAARAYAAGVVLESWLGQVVALQPAERAEWCLRVAGGTTRLVMPDTFFAEASDAWLESESIPQSKLTRWRPSEAFPGIDLIESEVPIIAGRQLADGSYWQYSEMFPAEGRLGLDVLGSAFFLLSRYEEVAAPQTDDHDRFPASASLATREGFLERPLLDEYVEVLWAAMEQLWPGLRRHWTHGKIRYSCDVDSPYERTVASQKRFFRSVAGDLVKRRSVSSAMARVSNVRAARSGDFSNDPNNTFDCIMDICEANGINGEFYFISGHSAGEIDGCYSLDEPYIRALLQRVNDRGHELGMHGSYNSFRDEKVLRNERAALMRACKNLDITSNISSNRQHYLRWDIQVTPGLLADVGFDYDTSGSFADRPGFRYGTGRSFVMWDWRGERALALIQRPLIVMECSVIAPKYLGFGYTEAALDHMLTLKERALRYGGDFSLLWHNSHLDTASDWRFLRQLLS